MSDPKLISPLLDGYMMGPPMSSRHGTQCCPAMSQDGEKKYIVKIISIPASQVQLEALLLTGAYSSEEAALGYFKEIAENTVEEALLLKKLASLEGFLPFDGWQVVRAEGQAGYQVYLLSPYKRSLERHFRRHTMTHLNAVNLGLDLCASLAVCRRAGYMYVDLKPENVFISGDGEFRIGDLGFVSLGSLKFTSLDERYHSPYTAPECADLFATLNDTADTYAVGMILYQTYNDGKLPKPEEDGSFPPPEYADYEMAEIILKAIAPDPESRWHNPIDMGQALVAYMQKNGANDVPIVPAAQDIGGAVAVPGEGAVTDAVSEDGTASCDISQAAASSEETVSQEEEAAFEELDQMSISSPVFDPVEQVNAPQNTLGKESQEDAPSADCSTTSNDAVLDELESQQLSLDMLDSLLEEFGGPAEDGLDVSLPGDDPANLSFLQQLVSDETAPSEDLAPDVQYEELSSETSDILAQADELISHETPTGVVAPGPVEIPMPEPIVIKLAEPEPQIAVIEAPVVQEDDEDEYEEDDDYYEDDYESSFSVKKLIAGILVTLLIAGLCFGGYMFYKEYYLQTIHALEVTGKDNSLSVKLVTDIDEDLLTIVCTDTYGTKRTAPVTDGSASFADLSPDTLYTISIEIDGFHKLVGPTTDSYTTPKITNIVSFTAIAGSVEGSADLRFKVDGLNAPNWKVVYSTEGEEERTKEFTENVVTVTDLTVGKTYTFQLKTDADLYIVGNDTLHYTALALVKAENLQITSCSDGKLTATWEIPEGKTVDTWSVRCYSDSGFDKTVTTNNTHVEFADLDTSKGYTVEVIADGMTVAQRSFVTANSVTVTNPRADAKDPTRLVLNWDYSGTAPEGEWLVLYTVDGSDETEVVRTSTNSAVIPNMVPNATYSFTLQTQAGVTLFGGEFQVNTPAAPTFDKYTVATRHFKFTMCETPDKENWEHKDIENFTETFKVGQKASFKLVVSKTYTTSPDQITTMYVIRDSEGKLISKETTVSSWTAMWYQRRCELDVPKLPETPGSYTMEIYFNGCIVHNQNFTITQ